MPSDACLAYFVGLDAGAVGARLILGAVIGFLIGLTGVGGGSMVIPALTLGLGLPPAIAVPTANFFSFLTKISAFATHWKLKTIAWLPVGTFLIGAVPGTAVASWLVKKLVGPEDRLGNQILLWLVFAVVAASILLLLQARRRRRALAEIEPETTDEDKTPTKDTTLPVAFSWRGVGAGLIVGLVIGSTSVGGGVVVIPLLALCFALPMEKNVGSSIALALCLTLVATLAYVFLPGESPGSAVDKPTAILMAVGSLGGVVGGSVLAKKLSESRLHRAVIGVMCLAALLIALKGLGVLER